MWVSQGLLQIIVVLRPLEWWGASFIGKNMHVNVARHTGFAWAILFFIEKDIDRFLNIFKGCYRNRLYSMVLPSLICDVTKTGDIRYSPSRFKNYL